MIVTDRRRRESPRPHHDGVRVPLAGGRAHGEYRTRWGWAVSGGVTADRIDREPALSGFLDVLRERNLRPLFVDVSDRGPFLRRGFDTPHYADSAVLDLAPVGPAAITDPGLRTELAAARTRLTVQPFRSQHHALVEVLHSCAPAGTGVQTTVAVDTAGVVQGVAVWGAVSDGLADRVLHLATARTTAPSATVALLIADAAEQFRRDGVRRLHLCRRARGLWPGPFSTTPRNRVESVARFELRWEPRWLALPSRWQRPAAAAVLRRERRPA